MLERIRSARTRLETRQAWEPMLRKYQPMVAHVCYQMLGPHGSPEDACHESLVRIMKGLPGFDGQAKVSTWMYRVAVNTCINHLRARIRDQERQPTGLDQTFTNHSAPPTSLSKIIEQSREPDVASSVEQEDSRALVLEALDNLDPDLRGVLLLRDAQGLDYAQIAEVLGVRMGTIKSRIFRARSALRQAVQRVRAGRLGPNEVTDGSSDDPEGVRDG